MTKKPLLIIAGCAVVWAVGSAVAPVLKKHDDHFPDAFNDHVLHERVKTFPSARDAPESGDGEGQFVLPGWVPRDAKDVKVKIQTDGNAKLMRFTLADAPLKLSGEKACAGGAFGDAPKLVADWFPEDTRPGAGRPDCSEQYQYRVQVKGDQVFAWSNGNLSPE